MKAPTIRLAAGIALLAANLALPVMRTDASGNAWIYDLWGGQVAYEYVLLLLPFAAAAVLTATGAIGLARPIKHVHVLDGYAGLLAALAGTRWFGFYVARLLDAGPTLVHLHAAPYASLAIGAALLAWSYAQHRPPTTTESITSITAAATLLLLPLLPFAGQGTAFHYDELTLETIRETGRGDAVLTDLAWARGLLWITLHTAGVAVLARGWLTQIHWAAFASTIAGAVFTIRYYNGLPDARQGAEAGYNHFLGVGYGLLLVLSAMFAWRHIAPWVQATRHAKA